MNGARQYLAVVICFVIGACVMVVVASVMRVVQPDSQLVRRNRLPPVWLRVTAWARSRSLRLWCPDPAAAASVSAHLRTEQGRRLRRLGVSMTDVPGRADAVVVTRNHASNLETERARVPVPCATIVLADADDAAEFATAVTDLAAALRWPDMADTR